MCHVERLAMDLPVTVGMQEYPVVCRIAATVGPPDGMMVMPSRESGNFLVTQRAETVLVFPEVQQLPSSFEVVCHLHAQAFLEGPTGGNVRPAATSSITFSDNMLEHIAQLTTTLQNFPKL